MSRYQCLLDMFYRIVLGGAVTKKITISDIDKVKEKERINRELAAKEKEKELKKLGENPEMEEENPNIKMAEIISKQGM